MISTPCLRVPIDLETVPKFSRLRRASPIARFAASAALEALGEARLAKIKRGELRVGVIFTLLNGCVNYSSRFFGEALENPALASPILFPETVFNAPSSHLSALIGSSCPNDTLLGDGAVFFSGLDLGIEWLESGEVDGCLVVAAEEMDWLSAEGLRLYSRRFVPSEGAGAVYLEAVAGPVTVRRLPDPVPFSGFSRRDAAAICRGRLAASDDGRTLLLDSRTGISRLDRPETLAWADWAGPRFSPKTVLGESMGAAAAWQVVAAVKAIESGSHAGAVAVSTGGNQQAAGIVLGSG
jgi:3-oxoacyl-(acyl-carrier-protein) synthase